MWYHDPKRLNLPLKYHASKLLENIPATAANIKEFLRTAALAMLELEHRVMGKLTMPVSADRCCDWKNTASVS